MICKVAVGGCARQLQREIVRFEAAGRGWREEWQGVLGQLNAETLYVSEHGDDSRLRLRVHAAYWRRGGERSRS
jgi:hypothetical protein